MAEKVQQEPEELQYKSPAERLAERIAAVTKMAKEEASAQINGAEAELAEALEGLAKAEVRLERAAKNVREMQDILGHFERDDLVMTHAEVDRHNNETQYDERVDPMVFGYSLNTCP
jgi:hypothetical protein